MNNYWHWAHNKYSHRKWAQRLCPNCLPCICRSGRSRNIHQNSVAPSTAHSSVAATHPYASENTGSIRYAPPRCRKKAPCTSIRNQLPKYPCQICGISGPYSGYNAPIFAQRAQTTHTLCPHRPPLPPLFPQSGLCNCATQQKAWHGAV